MKVFLSWSGTRSHEIAKILRSWLPQVIQKIEPYVSSEDIGKGTRWSSDIADELETTKLGIICITRDNMDAPWLNFEAGALSRTVENSKVCPILFDMERSELQGPLLQFMYTVFEKEDFYKVIKSLNSSLGTEGLEGRLLENSFEMWWPHLNEDIQNLPPFQPTLNLESDTEKSCSRNHVILEELLTLVREQQKILTSQERLFAPLSHKVFFEDLRKFEQGIGVYKTVEHLIGFIEQANLQLQELAKSSQVDGIAELQSKFVSVIATAKYLEAQLPKR